MSKSFETNKDLTREDKASNLFCSKYGYTKEKLGSWDIDFKIYKDNKFIGYLEVKGRNSTLANSYPLPVADRKIKKMRDKGAPSVILWACYNGIVWGNLDRITSEVRTGGRKPREGAANDIELMHYFSKQPDLIELTY